MLFMQDNASIHTARKVKAWFREHGIEVLEWPPYSPDLNLIEHLWKKLKELVYEVRPDIEQVRGGDEEVQRIMGEALERAWVLLLEELLVSLVGSIKRRVDTVIAADGWYTKY